ncbi:heterogeneous nuclear ribonucleoprotein 1-like [Typha latifolia]|uniref:heterogeneous nuclear ribonucleoprotein 1-like n=1 Tax=Typha latifolia TaxID=4733 RepID=UPI003C2C835C
MGEMEASSSPSPSSSSSSEKGKIFVGGISSDATEEELAGHFRKYGEVKEALVIRDRETRSGRGFGFVKFVDPEAAARALDEKEKGSHLIGGRTVEVRPAVQKNYQNRSHHTFQQQYGNQGPYQHGVQSWNTANDNNGSHLKKIFVGGLPESITDDAFKKYFETFGSITDAVVMYDNSTRRPRGFGFITFDLETSVEEVLKNSFHYLNDKRVEVKKAVPKDNRNHSNNDFYNGSGYVFNTFGGSVPAFGNYPTYGPRYDTFYGFASAPYHPYTYPGGGYGAGFAINDYDAMCYSGLGPTTGSPWSGQAMIGRHSPVPSINVPMLPGYSNGAYGGYMNDAVNNQSTIMVQSDTVNNQSTVVVQADARNNQSTVVVQSDTSTIVVQSETHTDVQLETGNKQSDLDVQPDLDVDVQPETNNSLPYLNTQ